MFGANQKPIFPSKTVPPPAGGKRKDSAMTETSETTVRKLVIIGAGPAGWTAALYASRAGVVPLVFEGEMGQLAQTTGIENYPGFPSGALEEYLTSAIDPDRLMLLPPHEGDHVTGPELVELMRAQALAAGAEVITESIQSVDLNSTPFVLNDSAGNTFRASAIIVATGASARYLGLASEDRFKNRGVSACAVCDGALPRFRDKPVCVIGGGDAAVEEAVYLARFASKVYLVHRRDTLRASAAAASRVLHNPKIEILWNRVPLEVLGDDASGVTGAVLKSTVGEEPITIAVTGFFLGIGHQPNVGFLGGQLKLTSSGTIERPIPFQTKTSIPGVFAAGDVADDHYRQAVIAAASGAMAALDAQQYLVSTGLL